jgi:hypothetical protein
MDARELKHAVVGLSNIRGRRSFVVHLSREVKFV